MLRTRSGARSPAQLGHAGTRSAEEDREGQKPRGRAGQTDGYDTIEWIAQQDWYVSSGQGKQAVDRSFVDAALKTPGPYRW